MLIQNSIIAGEILIYLEKANRGVTFSELEYYIEQPLHFIQAGVERLVRDGLAVLDVENAIVTIKKVPDFVGTRVWRNRVFDDELTHA